MKAKQWMGLIAGICLFAMASTAGAMQVRYDFEGENKGIFDVYTQTEDGLTVEITAHKIKNNGKGKIKKIKKLTGKNKGVYVGKSGLGVKSGKKDGSDLDGGKKGNKKDPDEGLKFVFEGLTQLVHLDLGDFGKNDDINLSVDGMTYLLDFGQENFGINDSTTLPKNILKDGITVETKADCGFDDLYFTGIFGKKFLVWVDGKSDEIRIDQLTVAPVPEPSTLLLLGAGIVGVGLYQRRKKS